MLLKEYGQPGEWNFVHLVVQIHVNDIRDQHDARDNGPGFAGIDWPWMVTA